MPPPDHPIATLAVAFDKPRQRPRAEQLAQQLNLPLAQRLADPHDLHLHLAHTGEHTPDRLELRLNPHAPRKASQHRPGPRTPSVGLPVFPNPQALDVTSPAGRKLNAPLFKAVGIRKGNPRRPHILDLTAGFLEDAWLLAAAGCRVAACEQHPVMFALLRDALHRAAVTHPDLAARITLHHTDAINWLAQSTIEDRKSTILYLDPMFPAKRKTAQRKPMRLARLLIEQDETKANADDARLLAAALAAGVKRVVVKRPAKAPPLAPQLAAPVSAHTGRALRFDVYVPRTN